jgi:hypothetical protein
MFRVGALFDVFPPSYFLAAHESQCPLGLTVQLNIWHCPQAEPSPLNNPQSPQVWLGVVECSVKFNAVASPSFIFPSRQDFSPCARATAETATTAPAKVTCNPDLNSPRRVIRVVISILHTSLLVDD